MGNKVSLREYARIRGVRLNSVQAAVRTGRIHKTEDGKIDVETANKEWFMNTDPSKSHKADPLFENPPEAMPVGGGGTAKQNFSTFQQAKTADVYYRAMLAKAKLKMITGETIDRKKAGQHAFNLGRALRDLFISFPTRYGSLIAAELEADEHKTVTVLDEYIRKLLEESRDLINREL
jgi:hypothetical protein